ncbi:hypothetical protein FACS189492_2870 [Clostridia bacterium]|nr:hypothetical protein FACS189492_2870 [Clostridia bacterium]
MKKVVMLALGISLLILVVGVLAAPGDPGGEDNPLVDMKYIESVLMPSVEQRIAESARTAAPTFEVIEVKPGQKVLCEAGTELILRMGSAKIIATQKGGIANVTGGLDLPDGAAVPANSLLIVPLADGRGVLAENDVLLMIKGGYEVQ